MNEYKDIEDLLNKLLKEKYPKIAKNWEVKLVKVRWDE